jgi:epsilon-lactone hydrolase
MKAPSSSWCTIHALTPRDQAAMTQLRRMAKMAKGQLRGVAARPAFDEIIRRAPAPEGVTYREDRIGGIPGWWCEPAGAPADGAILHLHGGWFNWGTPEAFQHLVGQVARSAQARAFIPDYGLAPEHPFPKAVQDVRSSLEGLLALGVRRLAVTGDSAGGNLALGLIAGLAAQSPPLAGRIAGAVALSPVTDLTLSAASWASRAEADPFFVREQAQGLVTAYLGGHDAADPIASPVFAGCAGLPPLRIHVGDDEVLRDDSLRYVERAVAAGVDATVDVWEGMAHGFLGSVGRLEAADAALQAIGAFLSGRLALGRHV